MTRRCIAVRAGLPRRFSKSPEYQTWRHMMTRCFNPKAADYGRYGGRGIVPCAFLRLSYLGLAAVLGERPEALTLERIDNNAGYNCGSCEECCRENRRLNIKWADRKTQSRNQTRIRLVRVGNAERCIGEWAEVTGIHYQTLMSRYIQGDRGERLIRPSKNRRQK